MGIALSLREVNDYYEYFFCKPPPVTMPFEERMKALITDVGIKKLEERRMKEYGQKYFQQVIPITTPEE